MLSPAQQQQQAPRRVVRATRPRCAPARRAPCIVSAAAASGSGAVRFSGSAGAVGAAAFGASSAPPAPAKPASSRFAAVILAFTAVPTLLAVATALLVPAPAALTLRSLRLPAAATAAACVLYYYIFVQAAGARGRNKARGVVAPATFGVSPEFDRYLRVQENTAEQLVLLLPTLWLCSALLSPSGAAAAGALWVAGRLAYARSYWADSRRRGPGFGVGLLAQTYLVVGAAVGAARALLA